MVVVRRIEPEMTYPLRHRILRPHQDYKACIYKTDKDDFTFHIGAFMQGKLISIASFYLENHTDFSANKQYRLRAMATIPEFRNKGAGSRVIRFAENIIIDQGVNLLWCKGRTSVQEYYKKLGFRTHGNVFDYPPIGPHIVMFKKLV
ncbi:GNAT family N-acetyltransferase [Thalassobacillus pellis]|uniref:GNAT family N-acetyltransferase n=1 Tax=Thalassobacillus pellis TaxID=748008 RepID=UPI001961F4B4|nr:GNAT family N-acetyltransferase [Thalassobacillus pellis]MBM7553014.1 GNAT superfamily N-acetyltransferase [Thalassobacillus pellis]